MKSGGIATQGDETGFEMKSSTFGQNDFQKSLPAPVFVYSPVGELGVLQPSEALQNCYQRLSAGKTGEWTH